MSDDTSRQDSGWAEFGYLPPVPDAFDPAEVDATPAPVEPSAAERARSGPTQSTELVQLARDRYRVVRSREGRVYAVAKDLPGVVFPLRAAGGLRQRLASDYYDSRSRAASGAALADALGVLEGDALRADEVQVNLRTGRSGSAIILDRATANGAAIKVAPTGWSLIESSPILFRRTALTLEMQPPSRGGSLDELRALLNVDDSRFQLIVAWIIASYIPDIAHPLLALLGQQGAAKSSAARTVLSFVDPSAASLRAQPSKLEEWATGAWASYGIGIDNVSKMPAWLQDALCRAVTGDALVKRELYTDDGVVALYFRRPIVLTSIEPGALQGDVADRMISIELDPILPSARRTEADVDEALDAARPKILGALLDLLAKVLGALPDVELEEKPRMADFAMVLAAVDHVTGWTTLADYLTASNNAARGVVDSDPFSTAVLALALRVGIWEGTCLDLMTKLASDKQGHAWPESAAGVAASLKRMSPALRAAGVEAQPGQRSRRGTVYTIRNLDAPRCQGCGNPLPEALVAALVDIHPTCEEPF